MWACQAQADRLPGCQCLHRRPSDGKRFFDKIGAGRHHLGRRVKGQRPALALVNIGRESGTDGITSEPPYEGIVEDLIQWPEATGFHRLADVRMVHHNEIVACREICNRMRLEVFERLSFPSNLEICGTRLFARREKCLIAARMVPGEATVEGHAFSPLNTPMAPVLARASILTSS